MTTKLRGLTAATHTPFLPNGDLNLAVVPKQAEHLLKTGVRAAFIGGTTGESHSLSLDERLALAKRWSEVVRGTSLKLIVHVGANCIADAKALATQGQAIGTHAVSALCPSYFKPKSTADLVACCAEIAAAAPSLPFYYYDIPSMTGVHLPAPEFLEKAAGIPNLAGIKFSNPDLMAYQSCLHAAEGKYDMPWGTDEYLLSALAVGAVGGVGSSYNFAAPIYNRLINAFEQGDLHTARKEQYRSVQLIGLLQRFGYMPAAKAVMAMLGVDVGPARLPFANLSGGQLLELQSQLQSLGFFDWL